MNERHFVVTSATKLRTNQTYTHVKDENTINATNSDLATLVRLRDSIIEKLKAYQENHYNSYTAITAIEKGIVAPNNKKALQEAILEIDQEIKKFREIATKYWGDTNNPWYAKSATRRYAHIDNHSNFTKYKTEFDNKAESKKILDGLKENEGAGYSSWWWSHQHMHQGELQTSKGYNFWYSLIRDHSVPVITLVYTLPLLIGVSIVHGIDALISHIRAFAADSAAETTFTEKTNDIEHRIKSCEKVAVEQTLFEITREFQTDEYKNFSNQRESLDKVGFFAKPQDSQQVSGQVEVLTPVYNKA